MNSITLKTIVLSFAYYLLIVERLRFLSFTSFCKDKGLMMLKSCFYYIKIDE
jgi:hypothetical protein